MKSPAWRLRLIDLETAGPEVKHLRPVVVVAIPDGDAPPFTSCAESLGRRICRDFSLDIRKVLWIEHRQHRRATIQVATFTPLPGAGPVKRYAIRWRSIRQNELETVLPFIPDLPIPGIRPE